MIQSQGVRQEQRQVQGMAPAMLASLKRLQMGRDELGREVAAELMSNPTLEGELGGEWVAGGGGTGGDGKGEGALSREDLERGLAPRSVADDGEGDGVAGAAGGGGGEEDWHQRQLDSLTAPPSLYEHLEGQLEGTRLSYGGRQAALQIIGDLDSNGWLLMPLEEVAREAGVSLREAGEGLQAVQAMDPCGVGGRGLGECLLLQLRDRGLGEESWPVRLVRDHLEDLGARVLPVHLRRLGLDEAGWKEAKAVVQSLDPRPGAKYGAERTVGVEPDVEIVAREDGPGYEARLLDDGLPRLRISRRYAAMLEDPQTGPEAQAFLREKIRSGKFLMGTIEQRRATLLRLGQLIADSQGAFMREGVAGLRAMTLQSAGKALGMHGTTIGRAAAGKYVRTPQGVKPMRFFFSAGGVKGAGEDGAEVPVASEAVKGELRRLVGAEDEEHPLSDEELAAALERRGIRLARRTVAKYREQLGIETCRTRKRRYLGR